MGTFVVERDVTGWPTGGVGDFLRRPNEVTLHFQSCDVRRLRSVVLPGDEGCSWLCDGCRAELIAAADESTQRLSHRVIATVLTPTLEERP